MLTMWFSLASISLACLIQGIMSADFDGPSIIQVSNPVTMGESPVWDRRLGKLLFVDIHKGRVMAYDFEKKTTDIAAEIPGHDLTPIILYKNSPNVLVAGLDRNLVKITLYNKLADPEILHTVQHDKPKNRFNDGKADSRGRVWIGTIGDEPSRGKLDLNAAALFKFTKDNVTNPTVMIPKVSVSNGIAWNQDGTEFYYIDTPSEEIVKYDYYSESGNIANKTVVFSTKGKGLGYPDGMTIDEDGNLWVALYAGGSVIQINPSNGTLIRRIPIPAQFTTSVAWGGPNLDVLFVTTARRFLTPEELQGQPGAGSLYAITGLGTRGLPDFEADI